MLLGDFWIGEAGAEAVLVLAVAAVVLWAAVWELLAALGVEVQPPVSKAQTRKTVTNQWLILICIF